MEATQGYRVLIVEDDALIGLELEALLEDAGMTVTGPARSVSEALASTEKSNKPDAAILDVNLGGETVFPLADALARAHVPFLFLTGHSVSLLPKRHRHRPVLTKPYFAAELIKALSSLVAQAPHDDRAD